MKKDFTAKKKNTLAKALLIALSVLCMAIGFGQSTLSAKAAISSSDCCIDPDLEPDVFIL